MSEELIHNISTLHEAILLKNYDQAIHACQNIELELEEFIVLYHDYPLEIFKNFNLDFHSTYLLTLLCNHQYDEAKYLWKRTSNHFKQIPSLNHHPHNHHHDATTTPATTTTPNTSNSTSTSSLIGSPSTNLFVWSWELGKLFFTKQIAKALQLIQQSLSSFPSFFPENVTMILKDLIDFHYQLFFFQLANAYQPLIVGKVAQHLEVTEEQAKEALFNYGYKTNERNEVFNESNTFNHSPEQEKLKKDIAALDKLAIYSHHLEREGLKVDLSNNGNSSSSNNPPTPGKTTKGQK